MRATKETTKNVEKHFEKVQDTMVEAEQQLGTQTLLVVDVRSTVIYNNRKPNVLIQHVVLSLPGNRIRLIIHVHHTVAQTPPDV